MTATEVYSDAEKYNNVDSLQSRRMDTITCRKPGELFGVSVPEKFPDASVKPNKWFQSLNETLKLLRHSQSDLSEDKIVNGNPQYDIRSCLSGVRMPTITQEIDWRIKLEMKDFESKLDPDVRLKLEEMKRYKMRNRKVSRFPCKIHMRSVDPKSFDWSEYNIIKRRRAETKLRSYELVHDFNHSRYKRQFVSQNYAAGAHGILRRRFLRQSAVTENESNCGLTLVDNDSLIVTFSFYQPVRGIKVAEFDVLGSQTLADVKDSFFCDEDLLNFSDIKYKGACFFINGGFYADSRDKDAVDYSHWIGEYLSERAPQKVKQHTALPMHETYIGDICYMLHQRCAFLHQGDCEHRVTVTSVRAFDPKRDCPYRAGYPVRTFEPTTKTTMCNICTVAVAERLIFNASLLPMNPMYLCRICAEFLLFDEKGNKVEEDDFIQFEYRDVI